MSLSPEQEALIADRLRVWEVHRACALAASEGTSSRGVQRGDAALDALLRCLLYELDGDIAAVTLLDQDTQYFLSVVPRSALHTPHLTENTRKWYGCQSISHHGGLCARTISMQGDPLAEPVFEILDLTTGHTRLLPVVDGTAASFRHYSGVPLCLRNGLRIGTLFVFKDKPALQSLPRAHRHFMHATARQAVDQIYLSIEALESKRALRCNSAVLSFLDICEANRQTNAIQQDKILNTQEHSSHIYQNGASLLARAFELEGVIIQELPWSPFNANSEQTQEATLLGFHRKSSEPVLHSTAEYLSKAFPAGAVCHLLSEAEGCGTFVASVLGSTEFNTTISVQLFQRKSAPEQFIFLPLLNTFHHRHTAFILGWTAAATRVLSSRTDLLPLSFLGWTIMSEIRRAEEELLDRKKNDFLGSVSHEMRSPLHGLQACIDLARETASRTQQLELLENARSCALQLGDTIDNILMYSNIGTPASSRSPHKQLRVPGGKVEVAHTSSLEEGHPAESAVGIMTFIEEVFVKERSKSMSMTPSIERRADPLPAADLTWQTTVVIDMPPSANFTVAIPSDVAVIVSNLLSNCLKFTGPTGCVRVSLVADEVNMKLLFLDSACGMSPDFVKHKLFAPFAQQDSLDPGIGLGMSLVHCAVRRLGGDISFQTDEAEGTEFSVSLSRAHFPWSAHETHADVGTGHLLESAVDFSCLNVRLFPPERWKGAGGDQIRDQRCLDALFSSLTRTLSTWCHVELRLCGEPWQASETQSDVVLLLHSDVESLRNLAGEAFDGTEKVIFCPDQVTKAHVQGLAPGPHTSTIVGPIVPWKIVLALRKSAERYQGQTTIKIDTVATSVVETEGLPDEHRSVEEALTGDVDNCDQESELPPRQSSALDRGILPIRTSMVYSQREPKLLLVDDNAINLKVLGMFAKRCSQWPAISAAGGREAIESFKAAWNLGVGAEAFDIILLDLSMPEVSGFDVAATIRDLELQQEIPRTYIVALTGLVSDQDREAAFAAGVDEYVTKPALLADLQRVVKNWRSNRDLAEGIPA